jgi:hypothetical protein
MRLFPSTSIGESLGCFPMSLATPMALSLNVYKIEQFPILGKWNHVGKAARLPMTMTYGWHESYKAALLETDWDKDAGASSGSGVRNR